MNPILTSNPEFGEPAGRYYARVDSSETLDLQGSQRIVQLDGVAAHSFHDTDRGDVPLLENMNSLSLAIMEVSTEPVSGSTSGFLSEILVPGAWVQVERDDGPTSVPVDYYGGLFADPLTVPSRITPLREPKLRKRLERSFSLDHLVEAQDSQLSSTLLRGLSIDFVTVLDVGQGNANALWSSRGGAVMYFDFGGGVTANARTYPKGAVPPCLSWSPPVVLSHWDWDHWSSVGRFPELFTVKWIVPPPIDLGPTHVAFAAELFARGNLLMWPKSRDYFDSGPLPHAGTGAGFRIERCRGSGRNDSGLAMVVSGTGPRNRPRVVLLSGDAAYDHIPAVGRKRRFDAVVVAHHGGLVQSDARVLPAKKDSVLVYSVGHANYYGHPQLQSLLTYLSDGWKPMCTHSTAQHVRRRPNSIAIPVSSQPPITGCRNCTPPTVTTLK